MGKRSKFQRPRSSVVNLPQKPVLEENQGEVTIIRVAVRSIYPSRLKYAGHVSGEAYEWSDAGAIVMVRTEDTPYLISLRIGTRSCCGGSGQDGNKVFDYEESQ